MMIIRLKDERNGYYRSIGISPSMDMITGNKLRWYGFEQKNSRIPWKGQMLEFVLNSKERAREEELILC